MAVEDSVAQDQLRAFIERIERLENEKAEIAADIKEIYAEAKGNGFDTKILRKVVTIRKQDANERMEQEALLDLYMGALGMIDAPAGYHEERERLNGLAEQIERSQPKAQAEAKPDPVAQFRADPAMHIVDPLNLKNKSESQPTKAAGSDLTNSQALNGQVASHSDFDNPMSTETQHEGSAGQSEELAQSNADVAGEAEEPSKAEASPAPKHAAPGVVTWEIAPPEGVERGAISKAFGTMGQDAAVIEHDVANASSAPIVKKGNIILDGWERFLKARSMGIEYPVVQYAGSDVLVDIIKLNVEGRKSALVAAFLAQHNTGVVGHDARKPVSTLTTGGQYGAPQQAVVSAGLMNMKGSDRRMTSVEEPNPTVTADGTHQAEVRAFLMKYYGVDQDPRLEEPLSTVTTKDRFGIVTVEGVDYEIVDIGMRMLTPRELFKAQGFAADYQIETGVFDDGERRQLTRTSQVRMCGNSVCPPIAAALVGANCPDLASRPVDERAVA